MEMRYFETERVEVTNANDIRHLSNDCRRDPSLLQQMSMEPVTPATDVDGIRHFSDGRRWNPSLRPWRENTHHSLFRGKVGMLF